MTLLKKIHIVKAMVFPVVMKLKVDIGLNTACCP